MDDADAKMEAELWGDFDPSDLREGMISPAQEDWESRADTTANIIRELEAPDKSSSVFPSVRGAGGNQDHLQSSPGSPNQSSPKRDKKNKMRSHSNMR